MIEKFIEHLKTKPDSVSVNMYSEPQVYQWLYKKFLKCKTSIFVLDVDSENFLVIMNAESGSFSIKRINALPQFSSENIHD